MGTCWIKGWGTWVSTWVRPSSTFIVPQRRAPALYCSVVSHGLLAGPHNILRPVTVVRMNGIDFLMKKERDLVYVDYYEMNCIAAAVKL